MGSKQKESNEKKSNITYMHYFLTVVVVVALAVIITISLMSCSFDEALANQLNEQAGGKEDLFPPIEEEGEDMTLYLPEGSSEMYLSRGVPQKLWLGEIKDGKVKVKIEYGDEVIEVVEAFFDNNIISIPVSNNKVEKVEISEDKATLWDSSISWRRVDG